MGEAEDGEWGSLGLRVLALAALVFVVHTSLEEVGRKELADVRIEGDRCVKWSLLEHY